MKLKVLKPIIHSPQPGRIGKIVPKGAAIELDDEHAEQLIATGHAKEIKSGKPDPEPKEKEKSGGEK
jgi:hypothetical protein